MSPLNLIDTALSEAKLYRQTWSSTVVGVTTGLTPLSRQSTFYLRVRESVNRGCREAVKLLDASWKRSIAYSILMEACYDIFQYGKTADLMTHYNDYLDKAVGTH